MDLGLTGRRALVTGASKGIGRAVTELLAAEGCNLVLASRTKGDLERVAEGIRARGVEAAIVPADLATAEGRARVVDAAGEIDILVNNAGAIPGGDLLRFDEAAWREAWELKVFGYIFLARAFCERMQARGRGVIINIIGNGGEVLDPDYICGATANAGLMAFTRALGSRSHRDGIRVVGINPGPVETERLVVLMRRRAEDRWGDPERWRELLGSLPFGRPASAAEIAAAVAMLASDRSAYTSGTVLTIDGGRPLPA